MNKSKFLYIIIIALLISNGILFFMLVNGHMRKDGPKGIIINKLHFDEEQITQYEKYIQQHRKDINENEAAINQLRSNLFEHLKSEQNTNYIDSMFTVISKQQYVAEKINYNHFLEIKHLCKPSQQKDFEELTEEIKDLFSPKERKK